MRVADYRSEVDAFIFAAEAKATLATGRARGARSSQFTARGGRGSRSDSPAVATLDLLLTKFRALRGVTDGLGRDHE